MRALILVLLMQLSWGVLAESELVLNDPTQAPFTTPDKKGFLDAVVGEAFRRAGYQMKLVRLPAERGLYNANKGIEDGDLSRIAGLEKKYPNLVRVPEKIWDMQFVAISLEKNTFNIKQWSDLNNQTVAIIRGWKIFEANIKTPRLHKVRNADIMFNLLKSERVRVIAYSKWMAIAAAKQRGIKIRIYEPALAQREMYIYLNKKHREKVGKISSALKSVKTDGMYKKLYQAKLRQLQR